MPELTATLPAESTSHAIPKYRFSQIAITLSFIWAFLFILDLLLGTVDVPLKDILSICLGQGSENPAYQLIVWEYRLPKAITASLAGGGLAVSGLLMQTLFRNPLAGPFILGISSGASLGVALLVLGTASITFSFSEILGEFSLIISACIGAALLMSLVLFASQKIHQHVTLLIMGLMFGYTAGALVSILSYFSTAEQIQSFVFWNMGSFSDTNWDKMAFFFPAIAIGGLIAFLCSYPLNALMLGESYAKSMGMNVKRVRIWIIISTSLLAGTVTSFCGPIAFLGVAVPHVARRIYRRSEHRGLIPICALCGMTIALMSDIISGVPGMDTSLPINSVTALIGAPFVIFIILKRSRGFR